MNTPLSATIDEQGTLHMKLTGTLDDSNFELLKTQIEEVKAFVKSESEKRGVQLPSLFDLSEFSGVYNVGAMLAFKGLEEHNRPYIKKTALFGGSAAARVAAELTLALIHKDNLQIFATKEEGEAWLKQ